MKIINSRLGTIFSLFFFSVFGERTNKVQESSHLQTGHNFHPPPIVSIQGQNEHEEIQRIKSNQNYTQISSFSYSQCIEK